MLGLLFSPHGAPKAHASLSGEGEKEKNTGTFKVPAGLQSKVDFWKKIYSEYTTSQVIIHDDENLDIIYEVLDFKRMSPRSGEFAVKKAKDKYRNILIRLAGLNGQGNLSQEEARVKNLAKEDFYRASGRVRGQLGQADRFREGIVRSGRYMAQMREIFNQYGLPLELTALPHVESSFQIGAYSKSGAAGIWQFMHSTGKIFMTINYEIDERRDPLIATKAAARLLKQNYEEIGSWPLAVTAYNHGLNGMKRAKAQFGDDIVKIIEKYSSRAFGFASQNFFCEFLAALEVSKNKDKYFPGLKMDPPFVCDILPLAHYYDFKYLANHLGLSPEELASLNPGLRLPVVQGEKRVPIGTLLKVPQNKGKELMAKLAEAGGDIKFVEQKRSKWYQVKRGDTLSHIAERFGTSTPMLAQLNHLHSGRKISLGQVLHLPQGAKGLENTQPSESPAALPTTVAATAATVTAATVELPPNTYRVKGKDTIYDLAKKHGIKTETLLAWNGLDKTSVIRPGQVLRLKDSAPQEKTEEAATPPAVVAETNPEPDKGEEPLAEQTPQVPAAEEAIAKNAETPDAITNSAEKPDTAKVSLSGVELLKNTKRGNSLGVVTVENNETLGHYSEWSELSLAEIRKDNRLRHNKSIKVGDKIKLVFKKVTLDEFLERRREFHDSFREDFYSNYDIIRVEVVKVKPGQSMWEICNGVHEIPYWLLKDYNPEVDMTKLSPGQALNIPIVNSKNPNQSPT